MATLSRTFAGFAIASILGILLGLCVARIGAVRWFFDPLISIAFSTPKIVFLPIIILWLGVYEASKMTMIVIESILPIVTATVSGVASVDRFLVWSARSMGASQSRILWSVCLPAAFPAIFTGMQVALPITLIVTIVCEMLLGGYGIGGRMINASRFSDTLGVFAGIVETAILGFVLIRVVALVRARVLRWHPESMGVATI
jgi:ABC-type nitrate/sulfonate/bicarbonate transport system permease component